MGDARRQERGWRLAAGRYLWAPQEGRPRHGCPDRSPQLLNWGRQGPVFSPLPLPDRDPLWGAFCILFAPRLRVDTTLWLPIGSGSRGPGRMSVRGVLLDVLPSLVPSAPPSCLGCRQMSSCPASLSVLHSLRLLCSHPSPKKVGLCPPPQGSARLPSSPSALSVLAPHPREAHPAQLGPAGTASSGRSSSRSGRSLPGAAFGDPDAASLRSPSCGLRSGGPWGHWSRKAILANPWSPWRLAKPPQALGSGRNRQKPGLGGLRRGEGQRGEEEWGQAGPGRKGTHLENRRPGLRLLAVGEVIRRRAHEGGPGVH